MIDIEGIELEIEIDIEIEIQEYWEVHWEVFMVGSVFRNHS